MPDPCPHCGDEHPEADICRPRIATSLADHLVEHPEDLTLAALKLQVEVLEAQVRHLTAEVNQHWH